MDGGRVESVGLTFRSSDEVFLGFFLQDYDRNRDGFLDDAELSRAERNLFREWRRHGFFALWEREGKWFRLYRTERFTVVIDANEGLNVEVQWNLPEPWEGGWTVAIFDPDYYHNVEPGPEPVRVEGRPNVEVWWEPKINREITFYYGQLHPLELRVELRKASEVPRVVGPGEGDAGMEIPELALPTWGDEETRLPVDAEPVAGVAASEAPATGVVFARTESLGGWAGWLRWLSFQQQGIREWMADLRVEAQEQGRTIPYVWMVLACFLYGVIHAAGPGHGKAALAAYFLGGGGGGWRACAVAAATAFAHAGSGMALVWIVHGVLDEAVQGFLPEATRWTQAMSAAMILGLGLVVASAAWRRSVRPAAGDEPIKKQGFWPMVFAIGIIPCPATVLVFLFCLNFNAPGLGMVLVLALATGMTTCLMGVAWLASKVGTTGSALVAIRAGTARAAAGMGMVSGVALVLLGAVLLAAAVATLRVEGA